MNQYIEINTNLASAIRADIPTLSSKKYSHDIEPDTSYIPCNYHPYIPCIWSGGCRLSGVCLSCPVAHAMGVSGVGYAYAPNATTLKYELICSSPYVFNYEAYQIADERGVPNWTARFDEMCHNFRKWLVSEKGLVRISPTYYRALDMILANLVGVGLYRQLLLSKQKVSEIKRNPQQLGYRPVQTVIEYLEYHKRIWVMHGMSDRDLGAGTWCIPAQQLLDELSTFEIKPQIHPKTLLLDFKTYDTKKKDWVQAPLPDELLPRARELQLPAHNYANLWASHTATLYGQPIVPYLFRVFNGSLEAGGRFYGHYLNIKKNDRARILIDGEETVEPDFTAFHVYILYAINGMQFDGDPYAIEGFDRDTVKAVFLPMLNHNNRSRFAGQITKSGKPEIKLAWESHHSLRLHCAATEQRPYDTPKKLKGFIESIPDHQKGFDLLEAIEARHPQIEHEFFSKDLGLRLQFLDSQLLASILDELSAREIPALPIHDSLRCKVSNRDEVIELMKAKYKEAFSFECAIK